MSLSPRDHGRAAPPDRPGIVIETLRLRLRSFYDADLAELVTLASDWQVARWLATMPYPYNDTDGRAWIARVQQDHAIGRPLRFAIALKATEDPGEGAGDRLIGGAGLDGSTGTGSKEPALGYWLGRRYWGKGYGREAVAAIIGYGFRSLGFETICAYTDPGNTASQKILLHCGLKKVGEIRLAEPTRHGAERAPLFRMSRRELAS